MKTGMRYGLTRRVLGVTPFMELTRYEHDRLVAAKKSLVILIGVEEKFDLLFGNYADFERSIFDLSLDHLTRAEANYSPLHEDARRLLDRRLVNVLSAARLYVQHVKKEVNSLDASLNGVAADILASEYRSSAGYRILESLRNHVQHRSLTVHRAGRANTSLNLDLALDVETLREDGSIKPSVMREIEAHGDVVPLIPLVREYVEALGRAHESIRARTWAHAERSEGLIADAVNRVKAEGWSTTGLAAVIENSEGAEIQAVDIFTDLIDHRKTLISRNHHLDRLGKRNLSVA
jgi:hypothetical protein